MSAIFITPTDTTATLDDLIHNLGAWAVVAVTDRAARATEAATQWVLDNGSKPELALAGFDLEATTRRLGSAHLVLARTV